MENRTENNTDSKIIYEKNCKTSQCEISPRNNCTPIMQLTNEFTTTILFAQLKYFSNYYKNNQYHV